MFFVLSKLLSLFIYPLSLALFLLGASLILRRWQRRVAWWMAIAGLVVLYVPATEIGADLLLLPLERPFEQQAVLPEPIPPIVVLAGAVDLRLSSPDRLEFNEHAERILVGLQLAQRHPDAWLLFAGGSGDLLNQEVSEAPLVRGLAIQMGIAPERILTDFTSRNTRENALHARKQLSRLGTQECLLITSASHMRRALGCFRKVGLKPTPYAVDFNNYWGKHRVTSLFPTVGNLERATSAIHEYVGLIAYWLRGYL